MIMAVRQPVWMYFVAVVCFSCALLSAACDGPDKQAMPIKVDFTWNAPCANLSMSPGIRLEQVPEGTVRFYVGLIDLDLPAFDHGGGFAPYVHSATLPAGAVQGAYKGPSPPYGSVHTYEIRVEALGPGDKVLGVGTMRRKYPPEGEEELRWAPCDGKASS